jgi:hypothetical protein
MERIVAWKNDRKWQQGVVAALALGLAGIARAHLALLLPVAAVYLLDSTNPRQILLQIRQSPGLWIPVLAGNIVLLSMILATRERGLMLTAPAVSFRGLDHIRPNLRSYLLYLAFPLPLAACWAAARWTTGRYRMVVIILAAVAVAWLVGDNRRETALVLIGGYALGDVLWQAWKRQDRESLFLCLWLLVPLPIVYYGHLPMKYLLPCVPGLILICFRLASAMPERIARSAGLFVIVSGAAFSMLILRADAEFANFGRDGLTALIRPHVLAGEKVWFPGQASSYWYAARAGGESVLPSVREPKRGDLLAVAIREVNYIAPLNHFPNPKLVQMITHRYRFGRTMLDGAGLYTNLTGNWLWTRTRSDDRCELWRLD